MNAAISAKPTPNPLPIAGIIPFSATDWPGKITVTAFTQGCPLRCFYCHNPQLQAFTPAAYNFDDVLAVATTRRKLIDALVISGGEPTAVSGLGDAIAASHAAGFPIGLHTCGYRPQVITALLTRPETTPDWVGLDIKALPKDMHEVTGIHATAANRVWDSLAALSRAEVPLQVRTTVWRGGAVEKHLPELQRRLTNLGHDLVVQQARRMDGSFI